jgi:hypothetical protein
MRVTESIRRGLILRSTYSANLPRPLIALWHRRNKSGLQLPRLEQYWHRGSINDEQPGGAHLALEQPRKAGSSHLRTPFRSLISRRH